MAPVSRVRLYDCVNVNFSVFGEVFPEQEKFFRVWRGIPRTGKIFPCLARYSPNRKIFSVFGEVFPEQEKFFRVWRGIPRTGKIFPGLARYSPNRKNFSVFGEVFPEQEKKNCQQDDNRERKKAVILFGRSDNFSLEWWKSW